MVFSDGIRYMPPTLSLRCTAPSMCRLFPSPWYGSSSHQATEPEGLGMCEEKAGMFRSYSMTWSACLKPASMSPWLTLE